MLLFVRTWIPFAFVATHAVKVAICARIQGLDGAVFVAQFAEVILVKQVGLIDSIGHVENNNSICFA